MPQSATDKERGHLHPHGQPLGRHSPPAAPGAGSALRAHVARSGCHDELAGLLLAACEDAPSALAPQGFAAEEVAELWWVMFWLGMAIFVAVVTLLLYGVTAAGLARPRKMEQPNGTWIAIGGVAVPVVVLILSTA